MKERIVRLQIQKLSAQGAGIAMFERPQAPDAQAEVFCGVPGDDLLVSIGAKRRSVFRGTVVECMTPSPLRVTPRCLHVGSCGGCTLQQMDYGAQLKEKEERLLSLFSPLVTRDAPLIDPIIPSAPFGYRNKMEFSFSQNRAGEKFLGLILQSGRGHVFNLKECHLTSPYFSSVVGAVRGWWEESGLLAYHMTKDTGSLRTLTVREGTKGSKLVMLTLSANPDYALNRKQLDSFIQAVKSVTPEGVDVALFLRLQQIAKGSPTQFYEMHLGGPDHLMEDLEVAGKHLRFKISPTSFFQPNSRQAEVLYRRALEMTDLHKNLTLFDLYCGTGTLGQIFAPFVKKVVGVELNPHAVFDADANKNLNGINNVELKIGDVGKIVEEMRQDPDFTPPDIVLVDPPRTGLDGRAIGQIQALSPKKIIYISCNPVTQLANIQELNEYKLLRLQPVDQFPHTVHLETVALLERV